MRAFDMKYYFVTKRFSEEWEKKVQLSLAKSDKTPEEIAGELGMEALGCRALLYHLCESGEVMEKHKGKFARA
jgi:DNA-directed RNA polymerase subunit N (RpoN/RPB10)